MDGYLASRRRPGGRVRAFDFWKDTPLAIEVAAEAPSLQFVFRLSGYAKPPHDIRFPANVTILPPTWDENELWDDIGCVLVTSRGEASSVIAYEAFARGIPVVAHRELTSVVNENEWLEGEPIGTRETPRGFATACEGALRTSLDDRHALRRLALKLHEQAQRQIDKLLEEAVRRAHP